MPRRKSELNRLLDDLLSIFRSIPWWVGPPVIVFTWVLFRFVVPGILSGVAGVSPKSAGPMSLATLVPLVVEMAPKMAPFAATLVAMVWAVALFKKLGDAHRLAGQTGIETIRNLHWREFEQLLADAFRRQGYSVRDTGPGADGGIDLILSKNGDTILVQAKQWKAWKVGVKVVRELFGIQVAQGASAAILVTSGRFTEEAQQFASENGVTLMDGETLARMIAAVQHARSEGLPLGHMRSVPERDVVQTSPSCPSCGATMVHRTAKRGSNAGQPFWGCSRYPSCKGTRSIG